MFERVAGSGRMVASERAAGMRRACRLLLAPVMAAAVLVPLSVAAPTAAAADPATNLSSDPGESAWNRVASSEDDVYAVWQDRSYSAGGMSAVVLRRSDDKGTTFQPAQLVSSGKHDAVHPAVAASGAHVYVTWKELDSSVDTHWQSDIWLARSDDHGASFVTTRVSNDQADSVDPVVVADGDRVAVVWNDSDARIMAATSTDGGETLHPATMAEHTQYGAHVSAALSLGHVHAAWEQGTATTPTHVAATRLAFGADTGDAPKDLGLGFVDGIAAWGTGVHVAFRHTVSNWYADLLVASSADAGQSWMKPVTLDTKMDAASISKIAIAADGGEVAVAWAGPFSDELAASDAKIAGKVGAFVARSTDGGRQFTSAALASSDNTGAFTDMDIATLTHTPAGRRPVPALTWTVPKRFGGDQDHDGLVDYLTTRDQVLGETYPADLDACGSDGGDSPVTSYTWQVEGETTTTGDCTLRHVFTSRGQHDVTLTVTTQDGDSETKTLPVTIKDLLVVSIGDSVASGEGNPDVPGGGMWFWDKDARWQLRRCDRSALAGPARAARRLEDADPQSSVTFLHLACSGATISDPDPASGGILTPYDGISNPFDLPPLPPQLDQLADLTTGPDAKRRPVDAMFVSIGANDLKFSNVIKACITGDCADPANPVQADLARRKDALPVRYDDLANWLKSYVPADRTFLTQYFDPTRDGAKDFHLDCVADGDRITTAETSWAYDNVVVPLNKMGHDAAARNGWHYVDGIAGAFEPHGYCAADSWVVQLGTSFDNQGGKDGAFHPNGPGHDLYGARLAEESAPVLDLPAAPSGTAAVRSNRFAVVHSDSDTTLTVTPLDGGTPTTVTAPYHPLTGGLAVTGTDVGADVTWLSYVHPGGGPVTTDNLEVFARHVDLGPGNISVRSVQVVQAPDHATALAAGKSAVLRVEIHNGLDHGTFVPVSYHVGPDGAQQSGTVDVGLHRGRNIVWLRPTPAFVPALSTEVSASVSIPADRAQGGQETASTTAALPVRSTRSMKVLYVPLAQPGDAPACAAVQGVARDGGGFAAAAFPVPESGMTSTVSCSTLMSAHVTGTTVDLVETLRDLAGAARATGYDAVVGVVPQGWFADHTAEKLSGGVGLVGGDSGPVDGASIVEAGVPTPAVAHELGHNLGLTHTTEAAAGYRFDDAEARQGDDLMDPVAHPQNWVSDATFQRLRQRLQLSSLPGGSGSSLLVGGVLADDGTVTDVSWKRSEEAPDPVPASGDLNVALRTEDGDVILVPLSLSSAAGLSDVPVAGRAFTARVPWPAAKTVTSVDIVDPGGKTLVSRPVSASAPVVSLTLPAAGDTAAVGSPLEVAWSATDADGDALTADVALSTDGGATWRPVASDLSTSAVDIPVAAELAGKQVTVRVTASDGVNTATATSVAVPISGGGVANGELAFWQHQDSFTSTYSVETVQPDGTGQHQTVAGALWPAHSPDGSKLAYAGPHTYAGGDPSDNAQNLFVADADGSNPTPVFAKQTQIGRPSWSPDGTRLAFSGCVDPGAGYQCGLWTVAVDGTAPHLVKEDATNDYPDYDRPAWSPDGVHLAYEYRASNTNSDIHVVRTDGTGDVNVSQQLPDGGLYGFDNNPAWSPDGSRIAFEYNRTGGGIAVMDADGRNMSVVLPAGSDTVGFPTWSPDGTRLAFTRGVSAGGWLWVRNLFTVKPDGTGEQQLTHELAGWSADAATWRAVPATDPEPTTPPLSAGGPYDATAGRPLTLAATMPGQDAGVAPLVTWDLDGDGTADASGVSPTVTFADTGTRTVTVRVAQADGSTKTADATVHVAAATPDVEAGPDETAAAGTSYSLGGAGFTAPAGGSYTATVAWGSADPVDATVEAAGGGRFVVRASHTLDAGAHDVVVRVCDADAHCGSDTVTVTAEDGADPVVTTVGPDEGPRGTVVTLHGSRLGGATAVRFGDTDALSVEPVSDREVRAVAPMLPDGQAVPVVVETAAGTSDPATGARFTGRNRGPRVTFPDGSTGVGSPVDLPVTTTDPDGDPVSVELLGAPDHGTAVTVDGGVRYTPDAGFSGTDRVTVVATDDGGAATAATAQVTVGSRAPVARMDVLALTGAGALRVPLADLAANDGDPDGDALHVGGVAAIASTTGTVTVDGTDLVYSPAGDGTTPDELRYTLLDATGMSATGVIAVEPRAAAVPTTLTWTGPAHVQYSDPLPASVHLAAGPDGVPGALVSVSAGGTTATGQTGADGNATVPVPVHADPGPLELALSYAGDDAHAPSSGTGSVVVDREDAVLGAPAVVSSGPAATTIVTTFGEPDASTGDLAGHTVRLALTDAAGAVTNASAVTTADGRAVVTLGLAGGAYDVTATFDGDVRYLPAVVSGKVVAGQKASRSVHGSGRIRLRTGRAAFSLDVVGAAAGGATGTFRLDQQAHGRRGSLRSTAITSLTSTGTGATFTGRGTWNGRPGCTFRVTMVDGHPDRVRIVVKDRRGRVRFSTRGLRPLRSGDVTIG